MLTEIAWLMTKAYIILIFSAAVIRSEQILYDTSTYIFRGEKKNGMYGCIALNIFYYRMCKYVDEVYLR